MSFLHLFFCKSTDAEGTSPGREATTPEEIFEQEFQATIPRYLSKPGVNVDLKMRHKETNEVMPYTEAFPEQFETWKTIQSLPDRRGLIYSILDNIMGNDLKLWQIIERFVDDRYAQRALEIAKAHADENDKYSSDYWAAVAKAHLILTDYTEAEKSANNALALDAGNIRAKIVLADVLHISGKTEAAHELYNKVLSARLPRTTELSLSFAQLVGFEGNILPSALYALDWLQSHPDTTAETWAWAGNEFYYSPHFRAQHAYYMLKEKEAMQGLVKLFALAKEMPWYKEAVVNSWQLIHQLGLAENMPEGKAWLESVMESNGWSAGDHGLNKTEI